MCWTEAPKPNWCAPRTRVAASTTWKWSSVREESSSGDWPKLTTPGISSSAPRELGMSSMERRANWKRSSLTKVGPLTACHPVAKDWSWFWLRAARGLLAEVVGAEHFASDARAGDGVARHHFVGDADVVSELERSLGGGGFGREQAVGDSAARRRGRRAGPASAALIRGAALLPGTSETSCPDSRSASIVPAKKVRSRRKRTVERGFGLVLAAVGAGADIGLGVARFDERIGGQQVDVAVDSGLCRKA